MKIYNTLTGSKEMFKPIKEDIVSIYVCGPTVYNYIHIGNARPMVVFDVLRRYLLYRGYSVKFVNNFTDVDDKIINQANEENTEIEYITDKYINAYLEDAKALNIYEEHTIHPKATEYIKQMIDFIKGLEDKGAAYNVDGNVYFRVKCAKDYGKLSKKNIEDLQAGARVDIVEEKENPLDFALWKKKKEGEPYWESPWGEGRPGWHIECSVMAKSLLGENIDIHAGGEDLKFPHHENEIAQSETLSEKPFANYWMHNSMVNVDNEKMSKSKGNFFTVRDVIKEYSPEVIRLWLLSVHYRNPISFSREVMNQTKNSLDRMYNFKENLERLLISNETSENQKENEEIEKNLFKYKEEFISSMEDDLNTADAVSVIYEMIRYINSNLNENSSKHIIQKSSDLFNELTGILGIVYKTEIKEDEKIEKLIMERESARKNKDYKRADEIREELKSMNVEIKDTSTGTTWHFI